MELPRGIRAVGDNKLFVDVTYRGQRRTTTLSGPGDYPDILSAALAKQIELRSALLHGDEPVRTKNSAAGGTYWTVQDAVDYTLTHVWAATPSEHECQLECVRILKYFGAHRPIEAVRRETLDAWVASLRNRGNKNATINRKLSVLSRILHTAAELDRLETVPKIPRVRRPQGRIRFLSDEEESLLIATLRGWGKSDVADAVAVLVDTGLRAGELIALQARDIDLPAQQISIWINKTNLPRTVPLVERTRAILGQRMADLEPTDRLFRFKYWYFRAEWDKARRHLGLGDDKQFVIHALRHTCATRMVKSGVPIQIIQKWLGHRNLQITLQYSHLSPADLHLALPLLEGRRSNAAAEHPGSASREHKEPQPPDPPGFPKTGAAFPA
ncbi:MAG: site-specific integrase [Acetobacterales bacterium]